MTRSLIELLQDKLGLSVSPKVNPLVDQVAITATKIFPNNPNRVAMDVINLGATVVYLMMDPQVSASRGIRLDANGGALTLNWEYDMELISHEWWAIAITAPCDILAIEVVSV